MKKVALILSGCGVYDGSEIHEVCAVLWALHEENVEVTAGAPSGSQQQVINHLTGEPDADDARNILDESARLVRGEITPLKKMDPADFDAVVLPGGFGAAKNLCDFATKGDQCTVHPEVESFLRQAHHLGKPIGAMCIAPVILARVFGSELNPSLTIGKDQATAAMVENLGARHVDCPTEKSVVDQAHLMVTTPAYMTAQDIGQVFRGAKDFINKLSRLCK